MHTIALDLNSTGLQEGSQSLLNEDALWLLWLIFQGGDTSGADRITTTLDNIRFTGGTTVVLGDVNLDGVVNGLDVDPFVAAVVGVQAVPEPSTLLLCIVALGVVGGLRKWGG